MNTLLDIWQSGLVNRWHNNPSYALRNSQDTNDAHMGRCVRMLLFFWPDAPMSAVKYIAHHDCPEVISGDIPSPAKQASGDLKNVDRIICAGWLIKRGIEVPRDEWADRCKFIDGLDAYLWARYVDPVAVVADDWLDARDGLRKEARRLGLEGKYERII